MQKMPEQNSDFYFFRDTHPNLRLGTASDRYAEWIGQIYTEGRYEIATRSHKIGNNSFKEDLLHTWNELEREANEKLSALIDIDKFVDDLIKVFKDRPPGYLPLVEDTRCPYFQGIMLGPVNYPGKDVTKYKCLRCSDKFYIDFRL